MRREMALMLLSLMAAQGCATGHPARQPLVTGSGSSDLEAVNRALADRPATVELKSGEKAQDVENVKMTVESTSWSQDDRVRTVPTVEVSRVTRLVPRRLWSGFGWGALAGVPVALLAAGHQSKSHCSGIFCSGVSDTQVTTFVLVDLACGLAGMAISGAVRQPQVVYLAPDARAAELLKAQDGSAVSHCRLASEQAPPGSSAIDCAPRAR